MVLFATALVASPNLSRLSAYSAGAYLASFLFIPFLALLRFLVIRLSAIPPAEVLPTIRPLVRIGIPLSSAAGLAIYQAGDWIGHTLYGLSNAWWSILTAYLAPALPIRFITALQRGILQANRRFANVALVDSTMTWCIGVPLITAGLSLHSPLLTFSYLLFPEMGVLFLFWWQIRRMLISPLFNSHDISNGATEAKN